METILEASASATTPVGERQIEKILVPTDFSARSGRAFMYALDLARLYGAQVQLLHVIDMVEGEILRYSPEADVFRETPKKMISDHLEREIARQNTEGVVVEPVTKQSAMVASTVVAYARKEGIDLIVIGTHSRHGVKRLLLGNIAEKVVQKAPCDVLIVATKA